MTSKHNKLSYTTLYLYKFSKIVYCVCKLIVGFMTDHRLTDIQFTTLITIHSCVFTLQQLSFLLII